MDKHAPRTEPKHFATLVITVFSLLIFSLLTGCAGFYEKTGPDRLSPKTESDVSTAAHSPANNENKKDKDTPDKSKSAEENTGFKSPVVKDLKSDNTEKPATGDLIQDKIQSRFDKSLEFYQTAMEFWQHGDLENALESLDNGYALIISTDTGDDPAFIQQKDDLRFMISKRILEIYASRHTTVKGNHNAIPVESDNEYVKKEIEHFTSGNARKFFINSYKRSGRFRPYITKALREAGLPEELSWLPLVESGYRTNAMSHARALGMWQFIASTGYKFGLKRDPYLDERLDPHKSTHAAIDYLRELHEIFGDWKTVLAAYNCGEGRVLREIRKQNINYLDDFWDLYEKLPSETAQYVPRFIATIHIVENLEKYGMDDIEVDAPLEYETLVVSKQAHLKNIAEAIGTTESELRRLNPELRYQLLPNEEYPLKVPSGKKEVLLAKIDEIPEYQKGSQSVAQHRVRRGDTLSAIALRYGTTVKEITRFNNIYRDNYIVAGQVLKIPGGAALGNASSSRERLITYKVRRGDSLWLLANRYNTTTKKIQAINNLNSVKLYIGQKLKIPSTANTDSLKTYRVKRGDSPASIASRHNMNLNELLEINQLTRSSRIYPDQELYVK